MKDDIFENEKYDARKARPKFMALTAVVLSFMMLVSLGSSALDIFAATSAEIKKQMEEAEAQKYNIAGQLSELERKIAAEQAEKDEISRRQADLVRQQQEQMSELDQQIADIEELYAQLEELEANVQKAKDDYANARLLFFKRISIIYRYSNYSTLKLWTESKSIFAYSDMSRLITNILDSDKEDLAYLEQLKADLDDKVAFYDSVKEVAEEAIREREVVIEKLRNSQEILASDIAASQVALTKLMEREEALEAESKNITYKISQLEKEYQNAVFQEQNPDSMLWPCPTYVRISSPYGMRFHPIRQRWIMHQGIDIAVAGGEPILSVLNGVVIYVGWDEGGYGNYFMISHGNGVVTLYAHCSKVLVKQGQTVKRGEKVGLVGMTGGATGNHLHFEVRINGSTVQPLDYFPGYTYNG